MKTDWLQNRVADGKRLNHHIGTELNIIAGFYAFHFGSFHTVLRKHDFN